MNASRLPCKLLEFNNSLQQQALFLYNYMVMFESLLLFVLASRQSLWKLHLASLHNYTKYFSVHDQLNYARLTPLYFATMTELEHKDEASWKYLEENYSISKTSIPFVESRSDNAMEQEKKARWCDWFDTFLSQIAKIRSKMNVFHPDSHYI